jgi:heparan-alpha-glucosaminide N-acetyltransferase
MQLARSMSGTGIVGQRTESGKAETGSRLGSLDAFRGFLMMVLLLDGYFPAIATRFPESPLLQILGRQFAHVDWQGGVFWDMIEPSFMFMVGVAMVYSSSARRNRGEGAGSIAWHVIYRSVVFVSLGLMLASIHSDQTQWKFGELLCQIGLAYPFAYLLMGRSSRTQWIAAVVILVGTWLAFVLYPLPGLGFDYAAHGASLGPEPFTGFFAHWNKYTNLFDAFDRWFLSLLPGSGPALSTAHEVRTLNFIPTIVTLLSGVMAGALLRSDRSGRDKFRSLLIAGALALATGLALGQTACPIVKSVWSPAYVLVGAGFASWCLAIAYWIADIKGWSRMLFPVIIVGRNSLVTYLLFRACREPIERMVEVHVGTLFPIGHSWSFQVLSSVAIIWLVALWLYRRKIFISV